MVEPILQFQLTFRPTRIMARVPYATVCTVQDPLMELLDRLRYDRIGSRRAVAMLELIMTKMSWAHLLLNPSVSYKTKPATTNAGSTSELGNSK
jgi:hypothetical protein